MSLSTDQITWSLLSRSGHVLVYIYRNPGVRMREISSGLGLTERTVQKIIQRLEQAGTLEREKQGRNNRYRINFNQPLPHSTETAIDLRAILDLILLGSGPTPAKA